MKRLQFYKWCSNQCVELLPSITIINYVNQFDIHFCWLVFGFEIVFVKKGWF